MEKSDFPLCPHSASAAAAPGNRISGLRGPGPWPGSEVHHHVVPLSSGIEKSCPGHVSNSTCDWLPQLSVLVRKKAFASYFSVNVSDECSDLACVNHHPNEDGKRSQHLRQLYPLLTNSPERTHSDLLVNPPVLECQIKRITPKCIDLCLYDHEVQLCCCVFQHLIFMWDFFF